MDMLQKSKKEVKNWLNDSFNYEFMFERPCNNLRISLNTNFSNIGTFIESLSALSYWYGANAVFKMPLDKHSACSDLQNMFFCDLIKAKFSLKLYQQSQKPNFWSFLKPNKNNKPRFSFIDNTKLLGSALSFGFNDEAIKIGENILGLLEDNMYYDLNCLGFPRYILEIFCKWQKISFPAEIFSTDISSEYRSLVNEIESADAVHFSLLISNACDYHLLNSGEESNDENKEFSNPVETLFATEILATYQIRRMLNKPVLEETHILIRDYLDISPIVRNAEIDYLLESVSRKVETL